MDYFIMILIMIPLYFILSPIFHVLPLPILIIIAVTGFIYLFKD